MQKKRKKAFIGLVLLTSLFTIAVLLKIQQVTKPSATQEENAKQIMQMVNYLLDEKSFEYEEGKMTAWQTEEKQRLLKTKGYKAETQFIRGSLAAFNMEYDAAEMYFQKSIAAFNRKTDLRLKARVYHELTKIYIYQKRYEEAEKALDEITKLYKKSDNKDYLIQLAIWQVDYILEMPDGISRATTLMENTYKIALESDYPEIEDVLYELARVYDEAQNNIQGMNYKLKALEIVEKKNNQTKIMTIAADIGVDYVNYHNYPKAMEYLKKAYSYQIDDKEEELENRIYILTNLLSIYLDENKLTEAEKNLQQMEKMIKRESRGKHREYNEANSMLIKAALKRKQGNTKEAFEILDEAKGAYKQKTAFNYSTFMIHLNEEYGRNYYAEKQYIKALSYFKTVEAAYLEKGKGFQENYVHYLYEIYRNIGNNVEAFKYAELENELRTKAFNEQEDQYAAYLTEKFDSNNKEKQISDLESKNKKLKAIFIFLSAILVLIAVSIVVIIRKSKEINRLNALFKHLSEVDGLTQIANRRALEEYLKRNWETALQYQGPISVAMLDVDFFKKYNDHYGHQAGDKVLKKIADIIKETSRKEDFIARYGGEEFILIMSQTRSGEAITILNRIREILTASKIVHEHSEVAPYITISAGIATISEGEKISYKKVIEDADVALYEAKRQRNTIVVYKD